MFKLAEDSFFERRKQDYNYADYLLKHKLGVASAGKTLDLPFMTVLKHDWSKLKPAIWAPHRDYFYSSSGIAGTNDRETYLKYQDSRKLHFKDEPGHHGLAKKLDQELESVADWYAVNKANSPTVFPDFKYWWIGKRDYLKHQLSDEAVNEIDKLVLKEYAPL